MSSKYAIELRDVCKKYQIYDRPFDRLKAMFPWNRNKIFYKEFDAIRNVNINVEHGEVVGIIGRNGAGKSTLLQIVAKTLLSTSGNVIVNGKVAALLELGSGFNGDFSGKENVFMSAAIAGLSRDEINKKYDSIVDFSGVREFIDRPVKTYSSGMVMRLAFAVATSVQPQILIIDEALSVGDGAYARKSFDRIMKLKENGCTILFCSHNLFQVESLCSRAIWMECGCVMADSFVNNVTVEYKSFLDNIDNQKPVTQSHNVIFGHARLENVSVKLDNNGLIGVSCESTLEVSGEFISDIELDVPSIAVTISSSSGEIIASVGAWNDGVFLNRDNFGRGFFCVTFPSIKLLKGKYKVGVYLFCERGLHIYDYADPIETFELSQKGIQQGIVELSHIWKA